MLSVNEVAHTLTLGGDDRSEEVRPVVRYGPAFVAWVELVLEPGRKVIEELSDLRFFPAVFTLIEVQSEWCTAQEMAKGVLATSDLEDWFPLILPIWVSVLRGRRIFRLPLLLSHRRAMMRARCSASVTAIDRGSMPERFGLIFAFIDREVSGVDADAGDVVTVGMELTTRATVQRHRGGLDEVLQVLTPQVLIADLASLGEGGVIVLKAVDGSVIGDTNEQRAAEAALATRRSF